MHRILLHKDLKSNVVFTWHNKNTFVSRNQWITNNRDLNIDKLAVRLSGCTCWSVSSKPEGSKPTFLPVKVSEDSIFRLCAVCTLPVQVNSLAYLKYAWCFCTFHLWLKKQQKNPASMGWTSCRGRKLTFSLLVWFLFSFSDRLPETRVFVVNVAFFVCFKKKIYIYICTCQPQH